MKIPYNSKEDVNRIVGLSSITVQVLDLIAKKSIDHI